MATPRPPVVVVIEEDAPAHHPGVVLRSQYAFVRALLAIALAAVAALSVAVVILAGNVHGTHPAYGLEDSIHPIAYGDFNPTIGRPDSAPAPQPARQD